MEMGELAIKKALKAGMDEAEAYVKKISKISIKFASEIQNISTSESFGLGLRVAKGKKIAMQATTIMNENEINDIVDKAVKIVKVSPDDPNWNNFPKKFDSTFVEGIFDKTINNLDYDSINDIIIGGINRATENNRKVKVTEGDLDVSQSFTSITNSYNETYKRKGTSVNYSIYTKSIECGESTGEDFVESRIWKDIDFGLVVDNAANKALRYIGAKPMESIKMPVIIKNKCFGLILGLLLSSNINADNIQKGRSTFGSKLNTKIAAENITLLDDGTLKNGLYSREFDDDGHPTQKTTIISNGILKNFIYDHYTAEKEGTKTTGNSGRSYWLSPTPTTSNLLFGLGTASFEDMIKDTKKGLLIEDTIGEWLSNPTSGELNAAVTHGYLIENGELTKPINNVIVAGNFFDILMNKIDIIGNDIANNGKVYAPSVRISELSIAGK